MMEKVKPKILSLGMEISKMRSNISIETKAYVDFTKVSMSLYYVKQVLWLYSSGCIILLIKLLDPQKILREQRKSLYECCYIGKHLSKCYCNFSYSAYLDR